MARRHRWGRPDRTRPFLTDPRDVFGWPEVLDVGVIAACVEDLEQRRLWRDVDDAMSNVNEEDNE